MLLQTRLHHSYEYLVDPFVRFLCDELGVLPREVTIVSQDIDNGVGLCIDVEPDEFLIFVKESGRRVDQVFVTIAHEMIHVKQYMTQELGRLLDEHKNVPYMERWWEKEAYEKSVLLVEKFAKNL